MAVLNQMMECVFSGVELGHREGLKMLRWSNERSEKLSPLKSR